jgi:hypothetical protein
MDTDTVFGSWGSNRKSQAYQKKQDNQVDTINLKPGNQAAYLTSRLKRDCPDLHARVVAGELSPYAAAIEAGFRKPAMTVPAEPRALVRAAVRKFGLQAIQDALREIEREAP